ncbi:formate dehydrogenase accessory sulfurtransferase FdhD [Chloroflexota bacterium]
MSNYDPAPVNLAETTASVACRKLENSNFIEAEARVVMEKELSVYVNGEHLLTASITPAREKEFTIGYLFGQGFIDNIEELESINVEGDTAKVRLKDTRKISQRIRKTDYRIVSGGGKAVFLDEMSFSRIKNRMKIRSQEIYKAMNTVLAKADIYKETEGVHAAGLFTPEAIPIFIAEDIGRHNTLDKVIGYALINKIDCSNTLLASTGRMASEMVTKICRAHIPVVATKTAVTSTGLEIGQKYGLTIIGFVRDAGTRINTDMDIRTIIEPGIKIYTNAQRIFSE